MGAGGGEQSGSDPLPYTQVDRAVKPAAALIAAKLGVTFQHALGGLVEFWQLAGDPRELEALLAAGKSEVVLEREEVARRFALAMGVDTEKFSPEDLASLRLLERRADGYRVRGMSRYFKPLHRRVQARAAAAAGGKASAKARAEKHGTAQPRSGAASGAASGVASGVASGNPRKSRSGLEANTEAPPNTADSVQRTAAASTDPSPASRVPKVDSRFGPLVGRLKASYLELVSQAYDFSDADGAALKKLLAKGADDEIDRRWRRGLSADRFQSKCATVLELLQRWNALAIDRATSDPRRAPMDAPKGNGAQTSKRLNLNPEAT